MAINLKKTTKKDIASIKGIRLGVASAGIKDDATDLLVILLPDNSNVAGLFTQNQFCAAPVTVSRDHLAQEGNIRALVINSGCANAGMGQQGMDDAITRAKAYIDAGADGIMIHSRKKNPDEILEFCGLLREFNDHIPIIVVPTSFNQITAKALGDSGVNVVIYANHMLRAAYPGMNNVATSILDNDRSFEAEKNLLSIKEILNLIPGTK